MASLASPKLFSFCRFRSRPGLLGVPRAPAVRSITCSAVARDDAPAAPTSTTLELLAKQMSPALLASSASLWAGAAWAEDAAEVVGEAPKDPVVEALFFVVVALLTVVTAGVAYLSLKQWLDNREEQQAQEAAKAAFSVPQTSAAKEPTSLKKAVKKAAKREKRGFGDFSSQ